jgi:hypothetical protein
MTVNILLTFSGLAPEIAHFRIASDGIGHDPMFPSDWYIKGAQWVYTLFFALPFLINGAV